jgi:hypothetical protein
MFNQLFICIMIPIFLNLQQPQNYFFQHNISYYPQIPLLYNTQTPYYSNYYEQQNMQYENINNDVVTNIK